MEPEDTHPFKCNFCKTRFKLMQEAKHHFMNFHQNVLEKTDTNATVQQEEPEVELSGLF